MKYITTFILLVTLSFASLEESDGGCYHAGTNQTFKVGTTYDTFGVCLQYTCTGEGQFTGRTCPPPKHGCWYGEPHLLKPFPECCGSIVCK